MRVISDIVLAAAVGLGTIFICWLLEADDMGSYLAGYFVCATIYRREIFK